MTWVLVGIIFILGLWLIKLWLTQKELIDDLAEAIRRARNAETAALAKAAEIIKKEKAFLRKDAVKRSQSVTRGRVAEQIAPYLPEFKYDPRDCRFLGSPVDFVIFDGLTAGLLRQVVFIEVKNGKYARLTRRERQVKEIIELKGARYEVIRTSKD